MSLFSLRSRNGAPSDHLPAVNSPAAPKASPSHPLDAVTGGAFSAPTSGERAARLREWLATDPDLEVMNEVFKEMSHRDRGAAKPLKEKLDELKRQKAQEHIAAEWAQKAQSLLDHPRMNLADAMAWQRDAARAGAPLSREPLVGLKQALAERIKAVEDLQHRVQVEREAAVLLAQRIEVLSTKPWREAQQVVEALRADVSAWQQQVQALPTDAHWASVETKFPPMLEASRSQLQLVWDAFEAALAQAVAADADPQAPLPAVPVWADELRVARGESVVVADERVAQDAQVATERQAQAEAEVTKALTQLERELAEGHGKATPKVAAEARGLLKSHGRLISPALEARAQALLAQAGELEGWQRWRADQLREELVAKAEGLLKAPEGQRLGGRKMQETLRGLREQWKTTDQGGAANHALWKRFDTACTEAHKVVEAWLLQVRQQADASKAQRQALMDEVRAWTQAHAQDEDWKRQVRELHAFAERWREAGHLSEKAFADIQPQWKTVMHEAHARLEAAQAASLERRRALIDEAVALGAAPMLRIDAVKVLQQRWQAEAQAVPLDRKQEQKLWDAFRKPIDEAFARKSSEREKVAAAVSAHDQRVLEAAKALEAAANAGDAQRIREAQQALEQALKGQAEAAAAAPAGADAAVSAGASEASEDTPAAVAPSQPARKLVAMRGDDRPGMKKAEPAARDERRPGRDHRGARDGGRAPRDDAGWARAPREARGPRLGDTAFRAQRQAQEQAELALRKLAAQAHGEVLTQVLGAWEHRDAEALPPAQALGSRVQASTRSAWAQAIGKAAASGEGAEALLRLEMAAEVPTPAEHIGARRQLQLQLLTRRNEPGPADTWPQDVARVLSSAHEGTAAKRLQAALKVLLRR
ncbi:DUF349 domain-containing protein [Hydrogenophaga sp. NFH-34]|uniref:DUF349 domain-containing protein n=1 Tax=Hydrogenophaga sp. NFH-34 TaxID=2744446 RepID=UPI001F18F7C4|nr:DUF349 domain-containing protein [Hydrogenophaga sp. NFH-34]